MNPRSFPLTVGVPLRRRADAGSDRCPREQAKLPLPTFTSVLIARRDSYSNRHTRVWHREGEQAIAKQS